MADQPFFDKGIEAAARKACPKGHKASDDWLERVTSIHPSYGQTLCDLRLMPNLQTIILEDWEVTHEDVAFISAHPSLCRLSLIDCSFELPVDLSALTNLTEIQLDHQKDFDLRMLLAFHSLTGLSANQCTFTHLPVLSHLTQLKNLTLCSCEIEEISFLSALTNLTELDLSHNEITGIGAISSLTNLCSLDLSWNRIADISVLSGITGLCELDLTWNSITDISALSGMTGLRRLSLDCNDITDIRALSGMTSLRELDLDVGKITDASPILNMKSLRRLKMNVNHLSNPHILKNKPFSKLGIQIPDLPEMEPENVRAERLRKKYPRVKKLCDIHSRVHFCRSAALVRLEDGMGRIALRQHGNTLRDPCCCDLYFDDKLLVTGDVDSGTSTARLYAGYGNVMTEEACQKVRDLLNADYESIDASMPALSPLLGLFSSGTYVIADFDLFPVLNESSEPDHFWDAPCYETAAMFYYGAFSCSMAYDAPLYLFPTQPAKAMNPAQTDAYIDRLKENDTCLRSVAFYLNGAVALLLDGHHKAAAAAALGKPARTLVIFSVEDDANLLAAVRQNKRIHFRHQNCYRSACGPLRLYSADGELLCDVTALETMTRRRLYLPADARRFYASWNSKDQDGWGRIPDAYRLPRKAYPNEGLLRLGTSVPPDQIRRMVSEARAQHARLTAEERDGSSLSFRLGRDDPLSYYDNLQAYSRLFPDSKWLTPEDRRFLEDDDDDPTWFPVKE